MSSKSSSEKRAAEQQRRPSPAHAWVRLSIDEEHRGAAVFPALQVFENRVVVSASYADDFELSSAVGCEEVSPLDSDGVRLVAVPFGLIREWLTDEEYEALAEAIDADDRLLSYAR